MKTKLIIALLLFQLSVFSQNSVEFNISVGGTLIDIEKLVKLDEVDGSFATDWGVSNLGVGGQYFLASDGFLGLGAELMYQKLYWYSVSVPYGTQTIYRDYSVSALKITPILRLGANKVFNLDVGPEFNFMDGLKIGALISVNKYFSISDKIDIPLKLRCDIMKNIIITIPISLSIGIRIKL